MAPANKLVKAMWVGPFEARLPGVGEVLVPNETIAEIPAQQAEDSNHWAPVNAAGKPKKAAAKKKAAEAKEAAAAVPEPDPEDIAPEASVVEPKEAKS